MKNPAKLKKSILAKANFFNIDFLTFGTKEAFIYLLTAFIKVLIFYYFDSEYYIHIKTDAFGYTIGKTFNQIILNQSLSNDMI